MSVMLVSNIMKALNNVGVLIATILLSLSGTTENIFLQQELYRLKIII